MTEKTINICGKDVRIIYCAASENGFETLSGKGIADLDFTRSQDLLQLALACIIAAYTRDHQEPPLTGDDLLYNATPQELTELYTATLTLRNEWYGVPAVVEKQLEQEAAQMTDEEKEAAEKNAQQPTTDT